VGEIRDVTDSARWKDVGWERSDVTDCAKGKGSVEREVMSQTVQGGYVS